MCVSVCVCLCVCVWCQRRAGWGSGSHLAVIVGLSLKGGCGRSWLDLEGRNAANVYFPLVGGHVGWAGMGRGCVVGLSCGREVN